MISQRIRQLRLSKGLTLQDIATELGVTRASVSKWESGQTHPEFARLEKLAGYLKVPSAYLLGTGDASPHKSFPVINFKLKMKFDELVDALKFADHFPTVKKVSDASFYVRMDKSALDNLGLSGIVPDSMILIDPELKPKSGELLFVKNSKDLCKFVGLSVVAGVNYYTSLVPTDKTVYLKNEFVVLGVALEAVHVEDLTRETR
jgi:transcriptional regulator with XRE-family HTH domain